MRQAFNSLHEQNATETVNAGPAPLKPAYLGLDVKYVFDFQGIKWIVMVEKVSYRKYYPEAFQLDPLPYKTTYHKLFL